jgi:uncharacterized protein with von Willebrand factor type A (vWA) domain
MIRHIVEFSGVLRKNGIPVSVRSTQLACKAAPMFKNNKNLKEALASIYLKDQRHRNKFNKVYESFFHNNGEEDQIRETDFGEKSKFLKKYKVSIVTRRVSDFDSDESGRHYKIDYIKESLNQINDNADKEGNSELLRNKIQTVNTMQPELVDLCQKLGQKIATKRVRRHKLAKKQQPDIRRSIRKNMKHGGTLLELIKSKPKIKKQNHYFLSDVSVSCDWISIWFFCMVYAAQNSFNRTRVFEFDNKTAEITSALYEPELLDAFIKVMEIRQDNSMIRGKSNMFTAFEGFKNVSNLNSKSYVLILSDCRDWAGPKEEKIPKSTELIENMVQKSKRVLILNPEEKKKWNVADSCVSYYEDVGAEIFEVRNLEQLANLIIEI